MFFIVTEAISAIFPQNEWFHYGCIMVSCQVNGPSKQLQSTTYANFASL